MYYVILVYAIPAGYSIRDHLVRTRRVDPRDCFVTTTKDAQRLRGIDPSKVKLYELVGWDSGLTWRQRIEFMNELRHSFKEENRVLLRDNWKDTL